MPTAAIHQWFIIYFYTKKKKNSQMLFFWWPSRKIKHVCKLYKIICPPEFLRSTDSNACNNSSLIETHLYEHTWERVVVANFRFVDKRSLWHLATQNRYHIWTRLFHQFWKELDSFLDSQRHHFVDQQASCIVELQKE